MSLLALCLLLFVNVSIAKDDTKKNKTSDDDTKLVKAVSENHLLFLNAANFDFSGKLATNYVGHVNIFAPNLGGRWGLNTGIMKLNYGQGDSSEVRYAVENTLLDPLQKLKPGDQYLKQLNKYEVSPKTTDWSFYTQPMIRIAGDATSDNQIFLHAHFELLVKKYNVTSKMTTIRQDTMVYNNDSNFVAKGSITDQSAYTATRLDGYFGGGLTFNLTPWNNCAFFIQPTIGITTDYVQLYSVSGSLLTPISDRGWRSFYLVRANYTQAVSDNATILLGMDIRGIFPRYAPMYAAYLGVNLKVDGALALLGLDASGNKKDSNDDSDDSDDDTKKTSKANAHDDVTTSSGAVAN